MKKKLVPRKPEEIWKEFYDHIEDFTGDPKWMELYIKSQSKAVKLTSTNGIDETIAEKVDKKSTNRG